MPSLVSHKWSIIKYVVLKKIIFFFLCFDRLIWTWTWLGLDKGGLDYSPRLYAIKLRALKDAHSTHVRDAWSHTRGEAQARS